MKKLFTNKGYLFRWLIFTFIATMSLYIVLLNSENWILSLIVFLLYSYYLKKFFSFFQGYIGEKRISRILAKVNDSRRIDNVILPGRKGNIDHIIFTKSGIICVETKSYSKKISIYPTGAYAFGVNIFDQVDRNTKNLRKYLFDNGIDQNIVKPGIIALGIIPEKLVTKGENKRIMKYHQIEKYFKSLDQLTGKKEQIRNAYRLIKELD